MKKKIGRRVGVILVVAIIAAVLFSVWAAAAVKSDDDTLGRTFSTSDELSMTRHLKSQPMTYKALINVPAGTNKKGVIFGNYREADISCANFEITSSGKPALHIIDSGKVETRIEFDYDVRGLGWIDLAITHKVTDSVSELVCYVNGVAVGNATVESALKMSVAGSQRLYPFALGRDWYSVNNYFKGSIKDVAIYDRALTADEISSVYSNGVDVSDASLMAYYDLTTEANRTGSMVTDSTDGDHDLEPLFQNTRRDFDYAYSFAVVGDTQHLVYRDAHYGTDYTSPIYDWIVANKDAKKIKFVMGLGDITDKNGKDNLDDGVDKTNVEWNIAVEQLNKLYEADIPYTLVSGNHDTVAQLDKFFADNPNFTNADIGYYSGESLGNYYVKFTADGNKYMVVALDYGANDNILAWAGKAIADNPDYKVIITTHAYMCADGTTLEGDDSTSVPRPSTNANETEKTKNNGDDMWLELASKYENIILVLSGHIAAPDVVYRKDFGDNGNTVYQMLINFQTLDTKYNRETGMVAMFYFSEDGKIVNVEYISAYKSLEAQKKDASAPDVVYRPAVNSFRIEYPDTRAEGEETVYGTISPACLNKELYPVVVFKSDKTFVGGFYNINYAMASLISVYNDQDEDYIVLLRDNVNNSGAAVSFDTLNGDIIIDLNGFTIFNQENYMLRAIFQGDSANTPSITFKNGVIEKTGISIALINFGYNSTLTADARCDLTFENVTFRSLTSEKNTGVLFVTYEDGNASAVVKVNSVFNDCTFDFAGSVSGLIMLPLKHTWSGNQNDRVVYDVVVNGGHAIASAPSAFTSNFSLLNDDTNGRADSIKFGANEKGEYLKLVLPADASAPSASYVAKGTDGCDYAFHKESATGASITYKLVNVDALKTKYGTIGIDYADADIYPVVLFQKTSSGYTFKGAYATFSDATTALSQMNGWKSASSTFVFLLRNNTTSSATLKFDQAFATYIVDLNGYTLTQTANYIFSINRTITTADPSNVSRKFTVHMMNGTLYNTSSSASFAINYGSGSKLNTESYATFFNFDNVTFKTVKANERSLFVNWESGASKVPADSVMHIEVYAVFNDCTFDLTSTKSGFIMIDMADDAATAKNDRTVYNVTINGGSIISPRAFNKSPFFAMNDDTNGRADSVVFGKNDKGEYIKLIMPDTVSAPSTSDIYINTSGVECVFAKSYDEAGNTVYMIRPIATTGIEFTPYMSLTLDTNLVMNVYVPKDLLVKFSFDGVEYSDLEALETDIIDGKVYYLLKISLPIAEAANELKLVATVEIGDKRATGTFTFSVIKYCNQIIASGTEIEKQLAKDVLSYIRAAYVCFNSADPGAIARIDEILGENYDEQNAPTIEGSTESDCDGFKYATFVIGAKPAMRFYLDNPEDAARFAFYIGGNRVATHEDSDTYGHYIEIVVYAYELCETVTYTVDGEVAGSYHINAYYNFVVNSYAGDNKEELITLTERFWKYLQSARAYRLSVLSAEADASVQGN